MINNLNNEFADNLQATPKPSYFIEDFFAYRHTSEYEELKRRGGFYKLLAFLKLIFF